MTKRHRPCWIVACNTLLRALQPGLRRKWVFYSEFRMGPPVRFTRYGFGRITHR